MSQAHRDGDFKAITKDKKSFIEVWKKDITSLYDTIRSLLDEFVKNGSMLISEIDYKVDEEALGEYMAGALIMQIANREIIVYPVARMAQKYSGVLVMRRQDRTSQQDIVRIVRDIGEADWQIQERNYNNANDLLRPFATTLASAFAQLQSYTSFDTDSLENALDFLLNL